MPNSPIKNIPIKWALLPYFVFTFYYFGTIIMTYFVNYPQLAQVQENIVSVMNVFNGNMKIFFNIPSVFLVISALFLLYLRPNIFPSWAIWTSVVMCLVSVGSTLFVIAPIHATLADTGMSDIVKQQLWPTFMKYQIFPMVLQVFIAVWFLNIYMYGNKLGSRIIFTIVFCVALFTWGTGYIEGFVAYPTWLMVGDTDWLAYRQAVSGPVFFSVFLIPGYLPLIMLIPMFWKRPLGIPKYLVTIMLCAILWIFVITAIYFVPDLQMELDKGYSKELIGDLIKYDFPLRGIAGLVFMCTVSWMFLKVKSPALSE